MPRQIVLATVFVAFISLCLAFTVSAGSSKTRDLSVAELDRATELYSIRLSTSNEHEAKQILEKNGFHFVRREGGLHYRYLASLSDKKRAAESSLDTDSDVIHYEVVLKNNNKPRFTGTDPLFSRAWHLQANPDTNSNQTGILPGTDISAAKAWDLGVSGAGVHIQVIDDGLDIHHPEFAGRVNRSACWNFGNGTDDPTPRVTKTHGTACGGAAAAAVNNTECGAGVAFGATLSGITYLGVDNQPTDAEALTFRGSGVDVSTNSWGATGPGAITGFYSDQQSMFDALAQLTTENRRGKGAIILFAGGNDGQKLDYCDREEKMASPLVLVIGATSDQGKHVGYSEPCSSVFVTAPSQEQNDVAGRRGIVVPKNLGNDDICDLDFSGTSAATPIVAGVAALVLEANPNLTYRDLQAVLATTATNVDSTEPSWTTNSVGVRHSSKFGFGRVNALGAVQAARSWTNFPPLQTATGAFSTNISIPDGTGASATATAAVTMPAGAKVEHVLVRLDLDHAAPNQVRIDIESPSGFRSTLVEEFGATAPFTLLPATTDPNLFALASPHYDVSGGIPTTVDLSNQVTVNPTSCDISNLADAAASPSTLVIRSNYGYPCNNTANIELAKSKGYSNVLFIVNSGYIDWKSTEKATIPSFVLIFVRS
eukprot:TRINITY_DN917_c0_g1_i2.p1 TRINITY_DN917_c0_g1~~TRINITY_DN917_c0_g1_i2.p1  ORF type:complete len:655 (+),score=142.60 TRINITY_DN917_c0_g1_i2:824-2788(+)